jgi:hypothetical protein
MYTPLKNHKLSPPLLFLRWILRAIRDIDGRLSTFAGKLFPTEYEIVGACKKRGVCCHQIAIYLSNGFWKLPLLRRMTRRYYEFVYNFSMIREENDLKVQVFRCNYVQPDGTCGIYHSRPHICRNYPQARYFGKPTFLPGCGYSTQRITKK